MALEELEARNLLSFFSSVNYSAGQFPDAVVVADFNGDGLLDLAVANYTNPGTVSILLGNGDGSFQPARNFPTGGNGPSALAVGDFNRDGKLDLAVANRGDAFGAGSNLSILLGNGDGTFGNPTSYNAGPFPVSVAVGDFNGDHIFDLVVANRTALHGEATIFLGYGDGTFLPGRIINLTDSARFPSSVAVGDFNGDGKLDFVVANSDSNNVSVLLGNGDGTFSNPVNYSTDLHPLSVAVADFNGDGKLDIVTANGDGNTVSVLLGNGNGTFNLALNSAAGSFPTSLAVGDFNGDGIPDLAVTNGGDSDSGQASVSVLLGNGDGRLGTPVSYIAGEHPTSVAMGDFNRDDMDDLVVANQGRTLDLGSLSVFLNLGFSLFPSAPYYPVGLHPLSVAVGSFNGFADAVTANNLADTITVHLGDGHGMLGPPVDYFTDPLGRVTNPESVVVGDFNNDGKLDIAVANFGDPGARYGSVSIFLGNGNGTFQTPPLIYQSPDKYFTYVTTGHFTASGNLDLALVFSAPSPPFAGILILLGNGNGSFSVGQSSTVPNASSLVAGDFNGDGKLDLAVANNSTTGTVSILLGNGDGTFAPPVNYPAGMSSNAIAVGDFNGDGKQDLAVTNQTSPGNVSVLLGNGNGTFGPPVQYPVGTNPSSIAVADFNGDSRLDLAVANLNSDTVSLLLGNGDGTFKPAVSYGTYGFPISVAAGDFNGDMLPDLVTANFNTATVSIFINAADWLSPSGGQGLGPNSSFSISNTNPLRGVYGELYPVWPTEILTIVRTAETPLIETPKPRFTAAMAGNYFAAIGRNRANMPVGRFWYNRWSSWSDDVVSSPGSGCLLPDRALLGLVWEGAIYMNGESGTPR